MQHGRCESLFARLKAGTASRGPGWLESSLDAALGDSASAAISAVGESVRARRSRPPGSFLPGSPSTPPSQGAESEAPCGSAGFWAAREARGGAGKGGVRSQPDPSIPLPPREQRQQVRAGRPVSGPPAKRAAAHEVGRRGGRGHQSVEHPGVAPAVPRRMLGLAKMEQGDRPLAFPQQGRGFSMGEWQQRHPGTPKLGLGGT